MKYSKYSVIVVGSGAAGLYLAYKIASEKHLKDGVLVVTKSTLNISSTELAQGGIVAVLPELNKEDNISSHISDTIKAGCGLNDFNVVKYISQNSSSVIQDLINLGVEFDKTQDNKLSFTLEAAHSVPRILHVKDKTGDAIEKVLIEKVLECPEIDIYENTSAVEILTDKSATARGIVVYNHKTNAYEAVYSNAVVLATGGIGQIYEHTTNPKVATGDGIALAYRAGAKVKNMEFVQFHPSALYVENKISMPLVSEAVRGAGAKLCDVNGNYFAKKYDERADLAPRDIVARAIYDEMQHSNEKNVFLDISQMGIEFFRNRFPNITRLCEENAIDISGGLIPVAPAAHYFMGGVETKITGETSISNLYAIGETACSGFHGANRLASNSLLECVVCAYELAQTLFDLNLNAPKNFDEKVKEILQKYDEENYGQVESDLINADDFRTRIKKTMWDCVGIKRDEKSLIEASCELAKLNKIFDASQCANLKDYFEIKNMLLVASLVAKSALERKNSIGAHYRQDYPQIGENSQKQVAQVMDRKIKNGKIFVE